MRILPRAGGAPALALALVIGVGAAAACTPPPDPDAPQPLSAAADTSAITPVADVTADGWRFRTYVNDAYPCAVSGSQTFTIGTRIGSSATATTPMWVRMRGGGVGFFDEAGNPQPSAGNKRQESPQSQRDRLLSDDLMELVRADPAGFRLLAVSMCDHDIYGGPDIPDPNNPNTLPDGSPRTVNGLFATKAAVQFATATFPTSATLLHGTSAGGFGAFNVAWGLEEQGIAPAGAIADSGILNRDWQLAQVAQGLCPGAGGEAGLRAVEARLHPDLVTPGNDPADLVADGRLTVPILQVWSHGDTGQCGERPMTCPLPDGTTVTMGSVDCLHEPMRLAIEAQGPDGPSASMGLCVDAGNPGPCDMHTPTNNPGAVNTDPDFPADFAPVIMDWVHARLGAA